MPFIPRPIGPGETLGVATDTIRARHRELAANGLPVSGTEPAGAHFGPDTVARLHEFQSRHGLAVTDTLTPDTAGVLALSTFVTTESDRTKLRTKLKDATDKVPKSRMESEVARAYRNRSIHPGFRRKRQAPSGGSESGPTAARCGH